MIFLDVAQGRYQVFNVYIVWRSSPIGNSSLLYSIFVDNGAMFGATRSMTTANPGSINNPSIAASGINVYVVWSWISGNLGSPSGIIY
jgi:hypothetical protein